MNVWSIRRGAYRHSIIAYALLLMFVLLRGLVLFGQLIEIGRVHLRL